MKLPWQCRLLGHDWRRQPSVDGGEALEFCGTCGDERLVLALVVKFPGQAVRAVVVRGSGHPPVATR